jgi:hypothetical protein
MNKRPLTLTVLCIISFIGSGLAFFTYSLIALSYEEFMAALSEAEFSMPQVDLIMSAKRGFFVSGMFLYGSSLLGVSLMWRLKKAGFHFYAMAQVLIAFHPWLFLELEYFPFLSLLASAIFILLYAYHFKYLH